MRARRFPERPHRRGQPPRGRSLLAGELLTASRRPQVTAPANLVSFVMPAFAMLTGVYVFLAFDAVAHPFNGGLDFAWALIIVVGVLVVFGTALRFKRRLACWAIHSAILIALVMVI